MKTLSSHLIATLAMLLSVSAATADSHATFGNSSQAEATPKPAQNVMWSVLPWFAQLAAIQPSVIVREAPPTHLPAREEPVRSAPTWTPVEEVEEHVRGGLALVPYLVSR